MDEADRRSAKRATVHRIINTIRRYGRPARHIYDALMLLIKNGNELAFAEIEIELQNRM